MIANGNHRILSWSCFAGLMKLNGPHGRGVCSRACKTHAKAEDQGRVLQFYHHSHCSLVCGSPSKLLRLVGAVVVMVGVVVAVVVVVLSSSSLSPARHRRRRCR